MNKISNYKLIIVFYILTLFIEFFSENFLNTKQLLFFSLSENLSIEQVNKLLKLRESWHWVLITVINLLFLLKITLISSVLYIGSFFYSNVKVSLKDIINVVLKAEMIFILVSFVKIFWFLFFQSNYTLEDIQYFYPLSAINITGYKGLEPWLIYPLQTLNLFELAYIIYLAYQIGTLTKTNPDTGLKIVAFSYVPALLLWVTVIMFFTLNYS